MKIIWRIIKSFSRCSFRCNFCNVFSALLLKVKPKQLYCPLEVGCSVDYKVIPLHVSRWDTGRTKKYTYNIVYIKYTVLF